VIVMVYAGISGCRICLFHKTGMITAAAPPEFGHSVSLARIAAS
jgi:hypothetical protein